MYEYRKVCDEFVYMRVMEMCVCKERKNEMKRRVSYIYSPGKEGDGIHYKGSEYLMG